MGELTDSYLKEDYVSDACDVYTLGFAQAREHAARATALCNGTV